MLTDKEYTDPEQTEKPAKVQAEIIATDVANRQHIKRVTVVYDQLKVGAPEVLRDLKKEVEQELAIEAASGERKITRYFEEDVFTDKIVSFRVERVDTP